MTFVSNTAFVSTSALHTCDPYIAHHGIKGQKWGVRRFQNEDGSLTVSGRARYASGLKSSLKRSPTDAKARVANYKSKYSSWEKAREVSDNDHEKMKESYRNISKSRIGRFASVARYQFTGKGSDAVKQYIKDYDKAVGSLEREEAAWNDARNAYQATGKNFVDRFIKNMKYG